jgi:hypothetical protein
MISLNIRIATSPIGAAAKLPGIGSSITSRKETNRASTDLTLPGMARPEIAGARKNTAPTLARINTKPIICTVDGIGILAFTGP